MYKKSAKIKLALSVCLAVVIVITGFRYLNIAAVNFFTAPFSFVAYMAYNFFPPSVANVRAYVDIVVYTIAFALVATYISAIFSFVFALLMVEATMPIDIVRVAMRFIMTYIRTIPVLLLASIMVPIFGIGSMVGLVALVLSTIGFLSRSYAENMNEIAERKLEPLRASGASRWQIIQHGLLPEFMPGWITWTLFILEINIRASAILGMVGAGGMGLLIRTQLELRNFGEVTTLVMTLVGLVLGIEFLAGMIRRKLIG